jgi:SpoIID/LytB domain protein
MQQPTIKVGILGATDGRYLLNGDFQATKLPDGSCCFRPLSEQATFTLPNVKIGIGFHWERCESQTFQGALIITPDNLIINELQVEQYLRSVISSEMNAAAPLEFLKAHAIVARSWLLAMLENSRKPTSGCCHHELKHYNSDYGCEEITRWYDREAHNRFDVCADDHCQRYQGINRATTDTVVSAIEQTAGIALTYRGQVCDARFSKCCGGLTEEFSAAWEDRQVPYLRSIRDVDSEGKCYCNSATPGLLRTIVNNYDLDSPDFFDWEVTLTQSEIHDLIRRKSNLDVGDILELKPLHRGASGRITRLLIRATNRSIIIGKELEIRRILSETHLKSSNFTVTPIMLPGNLIPSKFIIHGRGWGHGVGMCQIGAAVMAANGADYKTILNHYFKDAELTRLYQ